MAFDAGMVAAVAAECKKEGVPSRVEKVLQPDREQIILQLHTKNGSRRLLLAAGAQHPRFGFTQTVKENPVTAPMFCMLLRKHLNGARLTDVLQLGFERVVCFIFSGHDELGFPSQRRLVIEIMGKYSNLSLLDENDKIIGVLRPVDFSMSQKRQLLPGMRYTPPPAQDKCNPLEQTQQNFEDCARQCSVDCNAVKFLTEHYAGLSTLTAREIVFSAAADIQASLESCILRRLWSSFASVMERIRSGNFMPILLTDKTDKPIEYSFFPVQQYGSAAQTKTMQSFSELLDAFFEERDRIDRMHARSKDIIHLLQHAQGKLQKKILLQQQELDECAQMEKYRHMGELITNNLWKLHRGDAAVWVTDYSVPEPTQVQVQLDTKLTPSQNAQFYFKKYQKTKTAKEQLIRLLGEGQRELAYLTSVEESLLHAETETDLDEIRAELYESGYASRMKQYRQKKLPAIRLAQYRTVNGYRVLAGKNNRQNEYLTHHLAGRDDYWFHVKDRPGGHVVMFCGAEEPPAEDFTQAAMIAAWYAQTGEAKNTAVDYTRVRYLKKPPGAKPGMVIYHTYFSAYVTPDEKAVQALREP